MLKDVTSAYGTGEVQVERNDDVVIAVVKRSDKRVANKKTWKRDAEIIWKEKVDGYTSEEGQRRYWDESK